MSPKPSKLGISLVACLLLASRPAGAQEPPLPQDAPVAPRSFAQSFSFSLAVPLTGGFNVGWGVPASGRLVLMSFLAYFDRDWIVFIEPSDWHSYSGYVGTSLLYYPTGNPGNYQGYFVGGDVGMATSYQTYKPADQSDLFFFPFVDLYLFGYDLGLTRRLRAMLFLGGGFAPVASIVNVDGYKHDSGDFYPLADLRIAYRW